MTNEGPEAAVLIHELGGMLSSVQGFAHIAEANPSHPNRERFIGLAASEARRAAQALKDLHLARSLDRASLPASPPAVALTEVLPALDTPLPEDAGEVMVTADPAKLANLLARVCGTATGPVAAVTSGGRADVLVPIAPAEELRRRTEALEAPYPNMVTMSVLRRLVRHWGGDVSLVADGEWTVATVVLPRA